MAECQELLAVELGRAKELEAAIAAQEAEGAELEAGAAADEADAEALRAEIGRLKAARGEHARRADDKAACAASLEWVESMSGLLGRLSGVTLEAVHADALHLRLATSVGAPGGATAEVSHRLTLALAPGTSRPEAALLEPADVPVADIVAAAAQQGARRLPFLVREVGARLRQHFTRAARLEDAAAAFSLTHLTPGIVRAVLDGRTEAEVAVPAGWPAPGAPLRLLSLQSADAGACLDAAAEAVNGDAALAAGGDLRAFLAAAAAAAAAHGAPPAAADC